MSVVMKRVMAVTLAASIVLPLASAEDPLNRRIRVSDGVVFRGFAPVTIRAIETPGLFAPGTSTENIAEAFIRVSDVGATGVWFDLEGLDSSGIDPDYLEALVKAKAACIYRYIVPIMRILGDGAQGGAQNGVLKDHAARLAAVRTAARTFRDGSAIVYWIDGPRNDELAAEFKRLAPALTVLAPRGGDIDLIARPELAKKGRPSLLAGLLPVPFSSSLHCVMSGTPETYAAFEKAAKDTIENTPWTPTTFGLTDEEIDAGFVSLFDGESLDGWTLTGTNEQGFVVKNGAIEWAGRGGSVLRSRDRYGDFVLRLDWKIHRRGGNSGVFLRAPRANRMSKMGFEFQMMGDYGKEPDNQTTGAIYGVAAPLSNASKKVGEWNSLEIILDGPRYKATLNRVVVQDMNFDGHEEMKYRMRRGFIGLQDHSSPVSFRNIRIKKL